MNSFDSGDPPNSFPPVFRTIPVTIDSGTDLRMKSGSAPIKGKLMKIDTSTITLATEILQSKTTTAERQGSIKYWDLDDPDTIVLEHTSYEAAEQSSQIQWSESRTVSNNVEPEEEGDAYNPFNDSYHLQIQLSHLNTYLDEDTYTGLSEKAVRMLEMTRMLNSFEPDFPQTDNNESTATDSADPESTYVDVEVPSDQTVLAAEIEKIAALMEKAHEAINASIQPLTLNMPMFFICDPQFHASLPNQHLVSDIEASQFRPEKLGTYGYTVEQESRFTYEETEQVNFSADGVVRTEDGQELPFTLGLQLDRRLFLEEEEYLFDAGTFTRTLDPFIINLDGGIPQLSDFTFQLDLDFDGEDETIQGLTQGCGYLCFDKNGDGIINDGSELFGPATNNGFEELSQYDSDNNLWIDENDEIWEDLSFWEYDGDSGMRLTKLSETGLGAIYLDHIDTPFNMTDDEGNLVARITDSGIALNEDGSAASVQEIHWAV